MAVHWLLCTDIMADRFVSLIRIFFPLLLQIFLTKSVIFNTCKQRSRLLDNHRIWLRNDPHNNNVISCVKRNILYYIYCHWVSCHWYWMCNFVNHYAYGLDFWWLLWFWFLVLWQLTRRKKNTCGSGFISRKN